MEATPIKGKGERWFDCPHYESCLDFAAIGNWKSFNCESCPLFNLGVKEMSTIPEKKENTRICEKCGKNRTIQANSSLCASCIGKQAWKGDKKKQTIDKRKNKEAAQNETKQSQKNHPGTVVKIEFGKYSLILKEIEELADSEIRTVEEQIIYILKSAIKQ